METFNVRVSIEITPSTKATTTTPQQQSDGSFQITIAAPDALSGIMQITRCLPTLVILFFFLLLQ